MPPANPQRTPAPVGMNLDLWFSLDHSGHEVERSGQINRTVLFGKDHGLFWDAKFREVAL